MCQVRLQAVPMRQHGFYTEGRHGTMRYAACVACGSSAAVGRVLFASVHNCCTSYQTQQLSAPCQRATPSLLQKCTCCLMLCFHRVASNAPLTQMGCAWVRSLSKQAMSPRGWARWC
jgi:hypothetical protein